MDVAAHPRLGGAPAEAISDHQNEPPRQTARKRRRTTKACDDCRRKKIKCDGKRPYCTYASLSRQEESVESKDAEPGLIDTEVLRKRLQAAESLLRRILPHVDLGDANAVAASAQTLRSRPMLRPTPPRKEAPPPAAPVEPTAEPGRYITLIDRVNQLDLTETGEYDFHGLSSGAAFLSQIAQQFPSLRYDSRLPFLPPLQSSVLAETSESAAQSETLSWPVKPDFLELPVRQLAQDLCDYSFSRASCILRVVHAPSFWRSFDRLYQERPQKFTLEQRRFVGLLFSVMALGSMYDVDENDPTNPDHYDVAIQRGL
ncbi:hypothetical protein KJ359_008880 [Pestalotiopsis sp. 9143b]|nr:hypothetical protein KJ359_008880 [Pestalotiopsis sp. 9143b]